MKTNIVLIGFIEDTTKEIGKKLALDFDLYYADVEELIQYQLMNEKEIKKLCGVSYLNNLKQKVIKDLSTYENTIISMPYSIFSANKTYEMFKPNYIVVFLNFAKECLTNKINSETGKKEKKAGEAFLKAYTERTKFCASLSDIVIDIDKLEPDVIYKKTKKQINKYFL